MANLAFLTLSSKIQGFKFQHFTVLCLNKHSNGNVWQSNHLLRAEDLGIAVTRELVGLIQDYIDTRSMVNSCQRLTCPAFPWVFSLNCGSITVHFTLFASRTHEKVHIFLFNDLKIQLKMKRIQERRGKNLEQNPSNHSMLKSKK